MSVQRVLGHVEFRKAQKLTVLVLFAIGIQAYQVGAAAGGKPPAIPNYPIRVEFSNAATDNILSVGDPTYTNGEINKNGQVDVAAQISSSTGWVYLNTRYCTIQRRMQTCSSLGRYHFFDFSESVNPGIPLPTSNGWTAEHTIATAATFDIWPLDGDGITKLPNGFRDVMRFVGETRLAGMKVNFRDLSGSSSPGSTFTIRFTPNFYPGSSYLLVTYLGGSLACSSANPSECASWSVEAFTGSFEQNPIGCCSVSDLQDIAGLPNEDNSIDYGTFRMPFRMNVTVLPTK